jgi:protein-tyrosine phosphatase
VKAPGFVDVHSHVVPSRDDGAETLEEGRLLCREAARRGTRVLYATPHVYSRLPLTTERERAIRGARDEIAPRAGLELRLGWELTPARALLEEDPSRYRLEGTDAVLMELPFTGSADLLVRLAEHTAAAGLTPVIAHPERTEAVEERPALAEALAERGWLLQVNATSLTGYHGVTARRLGWRLVESGAASLVASDGHRAARPPHLDAAYRAVRARLGATADRLFDGSALVRRPALAGELHLA